MHPYFFKLVLITSIVFNPLLLAQNNTQLLSTFNSDGLALNTYYFNNKVYIADNDRGLRIIDVSNSVNPIELGYYLPPVQSLALNVTVSGNYAFVTTDNAGLRIVNITNPMPNIQETGGINFSNYCGSVSVSGNYAFVTNNINGLQIVDISNPSNPLLVKTVSMANEANHVKVLGNFAYVTTNNQGLKIINISNPVNAAIVGSYPLPDESLGLDVIGNYAYVTNRLNGLRIIDISNPENPQLKGTFNSNGQSYNVDVEGNYAYLADYDFGLRIINISDPSNPIEIGYYDTPGLVYGVSTNEGLAYVADYDYGISIIRNTLYNSGSITLSQPNGGEYLSVGSTYSINWQANGINNIRIEYTTNNGNSWNTIITSTPASANSYNWVIPNITSSQCKIKVSSSTEPLINDVSDNLFRIYKLILNSPILGQKIISGKDFNILWECGGISNIKLLWSSNNGSNWSDITTISAGSGSYKWSVPNNISDNCLIKIQDLTNQNISVQSPLFSIIKFALLTPNGGEKYNIGNTYNITWDVSINTSLNIYYSTDSGTNYNIIATNINSTLNTFAWLIPNTISSSCLVKITSGTNIVDESDAFFTISEPQQSIELVKPNGGEIWQVGLTEEINWQSTNITNVKIEYSTNNGTNWIVITSGANALSGKYNWIIPNSPSSQCKIKVSNAANSLINDESFAPFSIVSQLQKSILVNSPNGGETWYIGSNQQIKWTSTGVSAIKIDYSTNGGSSWSIIANNINATIGSYNWVIPNTASLSCKVRLTDVNSPSVYDISNSNFVIAQAGQNLTLTAPNGGESWSIGNNYNITWQGANLTNVKIEYTTNNGTNWITITESSLGSSGLYSWLIPNTPSPNCKVKIQDVTDSDPFDISDAIFTIPSTGKSITLNSPQPAETWEVGSVHNITWVSSNVNSITIDYSTNAGQSWNFIAGSVNASQGSYAWTIPNTQSSNCKVRLSATENFSIQSISQIFSIYSDSRRTTFLGNFNTQGNANNVMVKGKYAYVADMDAGFHIIDISNPNNPVYISGYNTIGSANHVYVNGNYAYVADNLNGLLCFNIADPNSIQYLGGYNTDGEALYITFKPNNDSLLYLADGTAGIKIFNIKNPISPILLGSLNTSGTAQSLKYFSSYLLVADGSGGYKNVNISNPASPFETSSWIINLAPKGLDTYNSGMYTYVLSANTVNGMELHALKWNAANPTYQTSIMLPQPANNIICDDYYAYVADGTSGVRIVSILNINSFSETGHYDTPGETKGVSINNNYIYLADGTNGLVIVKNDIYIDDSIILTSPTDNSYLRAGDNVNITFQKSDMVEAVKIEYSIDNGNSWNVITEYTTSSNYSWSIPNINSSQCKIKVSNVINNNVNDVNSDPFTIYLPILALTAPNGGEIFINQNNVNLNWVSTGISYIKIEYSTDNGSTWNLISSNVTANSGNYVWNIPNISSDQCKIKISELNHTPALTDQSDNVFTINSPTLILIKPNGGEWWYGGDTVKIEWFTNLQWLDIKYSTNNGSNWIDLDSNVKASTGYYYWVLPELSSPNCLVKLSDAFDGIPAVQSANQFFIFQRGIKITQPIEGENWTVSTARIIKWNSISQIANVKIELSTNNGLNWTVISQSTSATNGLFYWQVPNTPSPNCRIRISDVLNPADSAGRKFIISGVLNYNTTWLSSYYDDGAYFDVFVKDNYAYLANSSNSLKIFDITNNLNPVKVSSYPLQSQGRGIFVKDSIAFISEYDAGLRLINIRNNSNPVQVGYFNTPGYAVRTVVKDNYAFVADLTKGLRILNIQNVSSINEIANYTPPKWVISLDIKNDFAFIANYDGGLKVLNINNPLNPIEIGSLSNLGNTRDIKYYDNHLYIASDPLGLLIVNVENPDAPYLVNSLNLGQSALGVDIIYPYAYLACTDLGVQIVNISNINNIFIEGFYNTPSSASDIFVKNNIVFTADYQGGIQIFRNDLPGAIPVNLTLFYSKVSNNSITINWETATELNNKGFYIERRKDDDIIESDFKEITFIEGKGNSTEMYQYSYIDKNLASGKYSYRLKQIDFDGTVNYSFVIESEIQVPKNFELSYNYPNPFNSSTNINFAIPNNCNVSIIFYNILGEQVLSINFGELIAGYYNYKFDASEYSSGVYFYSIIANEINSNNKFTKVHKMLLLK